MAKRDLTLNEIGQLEDLVINEEYYLVIKHFPEPTESDKVSDPENPDVVTEIPKIITEKVLRFRYPSFEQTSKAERKKQSIIWEISKDPSLKDQRQVEEIKKKDIAEIRKAIEPLSKELENLQVELQKHRQDLPNPDTEPEKFDEVFGKLIKPIMDVKEKIAQQNLKLEQIYSLSIDYLAMKEYYAILTSFCWMEPGDNEDTWDPIWKDYEAFKQDHHKVALFLLDKTTTLVTGGGSFFGN